MLKDERFHFPLAAAQSQYRDHYPGMTSAALLEVVFEDTLSQYFRTRRPGTHFGTAPKNEPDWDYFFEDKKFGHKVGKKGTEVISVLWDATATARTWTAPNSIIFHAGGFSPNTTLKGTCGRSVFNLKSLGREPSKDGERKLVSGRTVLLVAWGLGSRVEILKIFHIKNEQPFASAFDPVFIHDLLVPSLRQGVPANHFEVLEITGGLTKMEEAHLLEVGEFEVESGVRPGIYLFAKEQMVDVPIEPNNRGLLVAKPTIEKWMRNAQEEQMFVPLPVWWGGMMKAPLPNLFLPQMEQFESLFRNKE